MVITDNAKKTIEGGGGSILTELDVIQLVG